MAEIVMFGAGKVADVLYRHITHAGEHTVVAFTTDAEYVPKSGSFHDRPVVAFESVAQSYPPQRYKMIVVVGYHGLNAVRKSKYDAAKAQGYELISYVSPRAGVGDWLQAGDNCIILDNAVIEPGARLGNNVVVWSGALVGHHTTIEDHAWIAGHAVFGGSAVLGARSFVGLGAVIGHEVELGAETLVGAGALVMKCEDPKAVFIETNTPLFRLDSERFLKITKLR
ncbi:MAG: acetyltransferase [Candidatus Aquilonibacter sp.]|jgi:sugar O-acyltransferase (sialic acid O-acetyltransferase NeuD family)